MKEYRVKSEEELRALFEREGYIKDGDGDYRAKDRSTPHFTKSMWKLCDKTFESSEKATPDYIGISGWSWHESWLDEVKPEPKYDFSKIDTDDLKSAVEDWDGDYSCGGIVCHGCPFSGSICGDSETVEHELFKEELARREELEIEEKVMTVKEYAEKYKGKRATDGKLTGIIAGYYEGSGTNILLLETDNDNTTTATGFNPLVTIMLPWEGEKNMKWINMKELKILEDLNEMPEIKAGMVVELKFSYIPTDKFLMVDSTWGTSITDDSYASPVGVKGGTPIIAVYKVTKPCEPSSLKNNLELIWSKTPEKTEEELKIEELEKTVETALTQIKELKETK